MQKQWKNYIWWNKKNIEQPYIHQISACFMKFYCMNSEHQDPATFPISNYENNFCDTP